jgi:hypothetical protein
VGPFCCAFRTSARIALVDIMSTVASGISLATQDEIVATAAAAGRCNE